jgi:hypothetical protein
MNEDPDHHLATPATHDLVVYEIRLQGHLDQRWSAWLDGLAVINEQDGTTLLYGSLIDQAALYGLLIRIRDLGLPLLSVQRVESALRTDEVGTKCRSR